MFKCPCDDYVMLLHLIKLATVLLLLNLIGRIVDVDLANSVFSSTVISNLTF